MSGKEQNSNQDPQQKELKELPPALQSYFRLKEAFKGPTLGRDEQGLSPKRFSKSYFEDTCPYCETTAEHQGSKYKYSSVTKRKIFINMVLMLIVAVCAGIGLINLYIGLAVIGVIGYSTSTHTERKMYYSLLCRKCGFHFPMNKEEQDIIRLEERDKKEAKEAEEAKATSNE